MDPNANYEEMLNLVEKVLEEEEPDCGDLFDDAHRMAELFDAIDSWIRKGGFMPQMWER